jgi:hypothetical protein
VARAEKYRKWVLRREARQANDLVSPAPAILTLKV